MLEKNLENLRNQLRNFVRERIEIDQDVGCRENLLFPDRALKLG